jgi:phosphatidylserine synthase
VTDEATDGPVRRRLGLRRGAYLLPSLFTMGSMVLGFYAIILGLHEHFRMAAAMVFLAGLLDSVDGRIARLTGTESDFGKEYDSLADVITFGAAFCICSIVVFAPEYSDDVKVYMQILMGVALLLIGVLMVSTFRYMSGKKLDLRRRFSYRSVVPIAAILLVLIYQPWATLLVITALYTLSGPVTALVARLRHRGPAAPEEAPPRVEGAP